jgi:hypothetical protein
MMRGRSSGFTLVEVAISATLFSVLAIATLMLVDSAVRVQTEVSGHAEILTEGVNALNAIADELHESGAVTYTTSPFPSFPYVFVNAIGGTPSGTGTFGVTGITLSYPAYATSYFGHYSHNFQQHLTSTNGTMGIAIVGSDDYFVNTGGTSGKINTTSVTIPHRPDGVTIPSPMTPMTELVYLKPQWQGTAGSTRTPMEQLISGTSPGALQWSTTEYVLHLRPQPSTAAMPIDSGTDAPNGNPFHDGVNTLVIDGYLPGTGWVNFSDGRPNHVLARHVEKILFEVQNPQQTVNFGLPLDLNEVRVTLWLVAPDPKGKGSMSVVLQRVIDMYN